MHPISAAPGQPLVIPLWADGEIDIPGQAQPEEVTHLPDGLKVVRNVAQPTLTVFLPDPATRNGTLAATTGTASTSALTAVIVCPGGANHFLAIEHEGTEVARWLNQRGIAVFLLKYRLVQTGNDFPQCIGEHLSDPKKKAELVEPIYPLIAADGCRAVRLVREHADQWGIAPGRTGIMGFSAGGMVTLSVALHYDAASRPDFAAPIYSAPPPDAPIPADAPPLFLLCAADDNMAAAVSTQYYAAWRSAGHPVELHIYAKGGHGFGMHTQGLPSDHWIERFAEWLEAQGFLPRAG